MHNFAPAIPFFVGISIAFGDGVALTGMGYGIGALGVGVRKCFEKNKNRYGFIHQFCSKDKATGAQAPGKPTKEDGYIPPKNWDGKKVRNPNGPGYGWPDRKGRVWVSSGPNGHGGSLGCPKS